MSMPKKQRKRTYGQKIAQRTIGQRAAFEFADVGDRPKDQDKPDWMIAREETAKRLPRNDPPKARPVEADVFQTMFFRGPAGMTTELDLQQFEGFQIPALENENAKRIATSLVAVKVDKEPSLSTHVGVDEHPVWEILRISGFKAANEGLKSAESLVVVRAPREYIAYALEGWVKRYGHTEVAPTMASPMPGASIVHKPMRGHGHHLRR